VVFDGEAPSRLLMISVDTTRRDQLGIYATSGKGYTPFIDSLALSGVHFAEHQQCSNWTFASTSCTLSGRLPEETGFMPTLNIALGDPDNQLPDGQATLAARLRGAGYHTILVSGNGWLSNTSNNAQGYDDVAQPFPNDATSLFTEGLSLLGDAVDAGVSDWMLHVHLMEPHAAYNPPAEYLAEEAKLDPLPPDIDLTNQVGHYEATDEWPTLSPEDQANLEAHLWARYRGELRYLDDQLSVIWSGLDRVGLLDDTLVVFWTDHGEQFFERNKQSHAYNLNAEENNGVWFVWAKNLVPGEWTGPTHGIDVVPTVLDALGVPVDPKAPALMGTIAGLAPADRARFASTDSRLGTSTSVTVDGWKLSFNFNGNVRLYDRNTDPLELVELYATNPKDPHVETLWAELLPRVNALHALLPNRPLTWPKGLPTK
jgi:arylsulfatase